MTYTPPDQPYTVARLAEESKRPRRTILNHIQDGQIKAVKLGAGTSAWIIPATEAERYLESVSKGKAA